MSTLKADTIQNTSGGPATLTKQQAAKQWANLNGDGTIALRDSFNTTSATDGGTGDYSFTLTNSMSDANYLVVGAISQDYASSNDIFVRVLFSKNRLAIVISLKLGTFLIFLFITSLKLLVVSKIRLRGLKEGP